MRVLFIHNYYQQSGGEDNVVAQEMMLLKKYGIDVQLYSVHNDEIKQKSKFSKAKLAVEAVWSYTEYKKMKNYLMEIKPDVVHVHNFFPLLSPSIYYACQKLGIPIVQTLHNYRLICPSAMLMRNNQICENCLDSSLWNAVKYGCYRDSRAQTLPVTMMIKFNRIIGTWENTVDRYIALTNFSKKKFTQGGISESKIVVKPNFLMQNSEQIHRNLDEEYILFVGRISEEKGIRNLLNAWKQIDNKKGTKLYIIGDGPDKKMLESEHFADDICFLGKKDSKDVLFYMKNAKYLIVPSIWYEGFPMTIVEAYSVGTPVLCSKIGSLQEVVINGETGFHFKHNNIEEITSVIQKSLNYEGYGNMRGNVSDVFRTHYTESVNFNYLMSIYSEVIKEKKNESKRTI
ncbi:glycosyl transferase [Bacillus luti]|uniref:glycosyltransferase n=1 Tax=Bacillus luti TaxID=2026191 RepID=UPI0008FDAA02|nr:glycosyltransferase [Bacillus luti]OJE50461.1 glycosyl transferase [Bacillus luti]